MEEYIPIIIAALAASVILNFILLRKILSFQSDDDLIAENKALFRSVIRLNYELEQAQKKIGTTREITGEEFEAGLNDLMNKIIAR